MDTNKHRRWVRDEREDRVGRSDETYGAWHLHSRYAVDQAGGWFTFRACDDTSLYVDAKRLTSDRVREERMPAHEAYSCPECVFLDDERKRVERAAAVRKMADMFDVPEHLIDGADHAACLAETRRLSDRVGSLRRDLGMAERSRDEWTGKAAHHVRENERLYRVLTTRAQERDDALRDREAMRRALDQRTREYDTAVAEAAMQRHACDAAVAMTADMKRERDGAVQASLLRIRERDEAVAEAATLRRALDDRTAEWSTLRAWKGTKIVVEDVVLPVEALRVTYGFDPVRTTTRYGRVSWVGGPLPYEPFCSLCPGEGRALLRRSSRENATDGLVFHTLGHHAKSVPVIFDPEGVGTARCTVPGCAHEVSASNAKSVIVRHEVTEHAGKEER
jgi:hypothetical protein